MRHRGILLASLLLTSALAHAEVPHPITPDDIARLKDVGSPAIAPAGDWVAYTVRSTDVAADKQFTHIWMTNWDGSRTVQLTGRDKESESSPHFSPDGTRLGFTSSRGDDKDADTALWVLDRAGGEARPLTGITGSVDDFVWSPDSKTILLTVTDPDPDKSKPDTAKPDTAKPEATKDATNDAAKDTLKDSPKPIVIDRFTFKSDEGGYLGKQLSRLWLYDVATAIARRLTTGDYTEGLGAFSPDGSRIVFVSNRAADPDRGHDSNLYIIRPGATPAEPTRLTMYDGEDNPIQAGSAPAWSRDGRRIAYIQGGPVKFIGYGTSLLATIAPDGGSPTILTPTLDRNVSNPIWSADGKSIRFTIEDDGIVRIASVGATGGKITPQIAGNRVFGDLTPGPNNRTVALVSTPSMPTEVFAIEGTTARQLSHQNDDWSKTVIINPVQASSFKSKDGTEVHGFITTPANQPAGPAKTILYNHGGPQSQFNYGFNIVWQIFAGHGYSVVSSNPRGSTGRGQDYGRAIYAAWGSVDVEDALSAVDDAVARNIADPAKLGVAGWSYGGMLTNYTIASTQRFKAAVSGASISNILAGYGTDQYINDYETELGTPWEHPDVWMKISYPFYQNQRITTPTLFMAGDKDFNVPLLNSEQMYQALRSRGIDSKLVIYPGEHHGLTRPSFLKDRMDRWLAWFDARVK